MYMNVFFFSVAGPSSVGSSSLVPGPSRNQPVSDTTSGSNIKEPVPIPDLTQVCNIGIYFQAFSTLSDNVPLIIV